MTGLELLAAGKFPKTAASAKITANKLMRAAWRREAANLIERWRKACEVSKASFMAGESDGFWEACKIEGSIGPCYRFVAPSAGKVVLRWRHNGRWWDGSKKGKTDAQAGR